MRRFAVLVPVVLLSLALATPALALAPTRVVETSIDFTFEDTEICGFPITFVENGTYKVTTFYNREGTALRTVVTNQRQYVASATANGKTLSTNYPLVIVTSLTDGTRTELGLFRAYHVPGEGVVLIDVGKLVVDDATREIVFFEAGQHDAHGGDASAFCAYFTA